MKRHTWAQRIVALFFFLASLSSIWGYQRSAVAQALNKGQAIPIVLFGTDAADASKHTDTLMVAVFDPLIHLLRVLSIPRDTRVRIPGYRFRRVNEIYGYHVRKTGDRNFAAKKVSEGVSTLLSYKDTPIDLPYFVQVDYSGFRQMVDLLGGVWITVKIPMHYDDYAGNYHFHKDPGRYLMNGTESLHYVRFRGTTGDRGRILRQQEFLRNMAKRFANPVNILRLPKMVTAVTNSITTNLSPWDLAYVIISVRKLRSNQLGFYILPGRPRGAYWSVKKKSAHQLAAALILGKSIVEESITPIVPQAGRITVKVWNASGKRELAYNLTKYLREHGYDVVDWGNYPINQVPTRVIDRTGRILNAKKVAATLSVESYHSEPNAKALADVEVIIGKNYSGIDVEN